ncbi:MAG: PD40 domain-containing protein [Anaerolineales bacterium]|nr:PD40 domain-containing protein [Anaerolineales bacterium]
MDQNEIRELLRLGIEAARNNNRIIARNYFRQVLDIDSSNESAWLWMAQSADRIEDRRDYLERVLEINPDNDKARAALEKIYAAAPPETAAPQPSVFERAAARRESRDEGFEENRDWLRPVDRPRRDEDLWTKRRKQQNYIPQILMGVLGIAFIGLAIFLFVQQQDEDGEGTAPTSTFDVVATQTAFAYAQSLITPSNTPRPTSPLLLTPRDNRLPPTMAPTVTSTPRPTATGTPTPNDPSGYEVIFVSNTAQGEPARLFRVRGNGAELEEIVLQVPVIETETPSEVEPTPEDEVPPEGETTAPETEATEVVAPPESVTSTTRYDLLDPALSPDGRVLVFTVERDGFQELYRASSAGGPAVPLTNFGALYTRYAAWSPDGQTIVFASTADGDFEIYAVELPTSGTGEIPQPIPLTDNDYDDRQPTWSPDGQYIAFASDRAGIGEYEIFVMPFLGSDPVCQMTNATGSSFAPSWSPDGSQIAFISNRGGDNDLYLMRYDGSAETLISVNDGDWQDREPNWTRDGQWLVISSNRVDGPPSAPGNPTSKLWILTPNGDGWRMITTGESNDTRPLWTNQLPPNQEPVITSDFEFRCASR